MTNSSWSWRIPSVLQGGPAIAQLIFFWFGPESPRWLVAKGREADAVQTLAYYHADGDDTDPLVQYEFEEIKAAIDLDRTGMSSTLDVCANVVTNSPISCTERRLEVSLHHYR